MSINAYHEDSSPLKKKLVIHTIKNIKEIFMSHFFSSKLLKQLSFILFIIFATFLSKQKFSLLTKKADQ